MTFVGIDPGKAGGIAIIGDAGDVLTVCKMPATELDVLSVLRSVDGAGGTRAALERVRSSPQMGVVSAFTFGWGYGGLRMALTAASIPFDEVLPTRWQQALNCRTGGRIGARRADKHATRRRAQELFPQVKVTMATADALLLAEYARRTHRRLDDDQRPG